jgi:tol-pal system protein YbgF
MTLRNATSLPILFGGLVSFVMVVGFYSPNLSAQTISLDSASFMQRLGRIESRLGAMESGTAAAPTGTAGASTLYGSADVSRRLEEVEQESAQRNGAIERLQFAIQAVAKRVDDVTKDTDLRLNEIEKRLQALEVKTPAGPSVAPSAVLPTAVSVTIPVSMTAVDHYNKAYAYLTATQYAQAEAWLAAFVKRHPTDKLADNAFYWLGETRLVQNNAAAAVQAFRDGLRAFPKGAKAPDNYYKMGIALEQLKQPELAKASWQKLIKDYPASTQATRAKGRLLGLKQ